MSTVDLNQMQSVGRKQREEFFFKKKGITFKIKQEVTGQNKRIKTSQTTHMRKKGKIKIQ